MLESLIRTRLEVQAWLLMLIMYVYLHLVRTFITFDKKKCLHVLRMYEGRFFASHGQSDCALGGICFVEKVKKQDYCRV